MEFQTPKETLLKGIQVVQNVAAGRTTLPILNNILIKTAKNRIVLVTTDLEIGMLCEVPGQILKEGSITVPAKRFGDIIRELPDEEVKVEVKKNDQVNIRDKHCLFKLIGLPEDEFPQLPDFSKDEKIILPQAEVKKMLTMTAYALSYDQTRYVLNGVFLSVRPDQIKAVATDGRRLALFVLSNPAEEKKAKREVIVPAKTVTELIRNLKDAGEVRISFKKNQISFAFNEIVLISRLIEGDYPDYERVLPEETQEKLKINRESLFMAVKRAALLANTESPAVIFELGNNRLVVSKKTPEVGEAREEVKGEYQGPEVRVGYNPAFLLDVLKNLDQKDVEFEIPGADKPGVIRSKNQFVYVILPIELV